MNRTRRVTATALTTVTLAVAYLTYLATAGSAGAMPKPPPETYVNQPTLPPVTTTTVVSHPGSPVWTYVVVALAAAALTLAVIWMAARRHMHAAAHISTSPVSAS
jgi:hypothetical protein